MRAQMRGQPPRSDAAPLCKARTRLAYPLLFSQPRNFNTCNQESIMNLRRFAHCFLPALFACATPFLSACAPTVELDGISGAPVVDETSQSSESIKVGETVHFRIKAHDPENDSLIFTWSATGGMLGMPATSVFESEVDWTAPSSSGMYTVTGRVQDAQKKVTTYNFGVVVDGPVQMGNSVTLAAGLTLPGAIAVDGTDVYWLNGGSSDPMNPGGSLMKCSIDGCNGMPTVLALGLSGPSRMVLDATTVYFTQTGTDGFGTEGGLRWCEKNGCQGMPAYVEGGFSNYGIAIHDNNLYWAAWDGGTTTIRSSTIPYAFPPIGIVSFSGYALDLATTASSLLWTASPPGNAVWQVALPGLGAPEQLGGTEPIAPGAIAVDTTNAYWISGNNSIVKCALAGCGGVPTTLVSDLDIPSAIATDGVNVYFTLTPMGPGGAVMKCPVDGGVPTTIATGADVFSPGAIAVDATSVYWTDYNTGTVMKATK
jgi:hypothetical protein